MKKTILALIVILLAGCSTDFSQPFSEKSLSPQEYLNMSNTASPLLALNHRLNAALLFVQAGGNDEAKQAIRNINWDINDPKLPGEVLAAVQKLSLQTRFALVNHDNKTAIASLTRAISLLRPYAREEQPSQQAKTGGVALLLPTSGPHAEGAKSIRDGFLAAYYQNSGQGGEKEVKFYDTGNGNKIQEAYNQAIAENARLIVGPLTKPEVQALSKMNLEVPVLALNTISEDAANPRQLYQFGLMPEDEIIAVSGQAIRNNHRYALIIAPQNEWGQRLVKAFKRHYNSHGGRVLETQFFNSHAELEEKLKSLLQVENGKIRQDADMILLATNHDSAKLIKPIINRYQVGNFPIYASAAVYSGWIDANRDKELEGIHFCDMPWVLQNSTHIQQAHATFDKLWPQSAARSPRFFALGLDAHQLAAALQNSNLSSGKISGYTGDLQVNQYQRIERGLTCVKFEQGIPIPD